MLYLKENANVYRVTNDDILYLQQNGRHISIVTSDREYTLRKHKIRDVEKNAWRALF